MTKRAAILFELPGSCDYWKDERLHEVVHDDDGISHEFDGCRYGLKQRYAKKPMPIKKPWRVVSWNFDLGSSLSKKCSGNHEHGPCAGRETKETQLYTSLIVCVILRRFRARAKCLQPAPLREGIRGSIKLLRVRFAPPRLYQRGAGLVPNLRFQRGTGLVPNLKFRRGVGPVPHLN